MRVWLPPPPPPPPPGEGVRASHLWRESASLVRHVRTGPCGASVTTAPTRAARLAHLDAQLARDPDAIEPRYARASLLREAGRTEEAKRDYLALLQRAPTHYGALNDFGTMLLATGYRDAARTVFEQAVRHHPGRPDGRVNLANLLFKIDELAAARNHFEAALRADPDHVHAHRGLANVLAEIGDEGGARTHRDRGFKGHALTTLPY